MLAFVALGAAIAAPVSDGVRWVAIPRAPGVVEVRDDLKGIKRTLRLPCDVVGVSRAGVLTTGCVDRTYTTIDLTTGGRATFSVPQPADFAFDSALTVGRVWIEVYTSGYHFGGVRYVNRASGAVGAVGPREYADLDAPALARPLCAPLRRPSDPADGSPPPVFTTDPLASGWDDRLWFCGDKRPRRLRDALSLTVGGGWATWEVGNAIEYERLRDRHRFESGGRSGDLVHTRRAVYVRDGGRVYRARLPRAAS
jgi:hypothetical protein